MKSPKPTAEEIKAAKNLLQRAKALAYWESVRADPEQYKERIKQVREASKVAAKLKLGKV